MPAVHPEVNTLFHVRASLDVALSADVGSLAVGEVEHADAASSALHDGWFLDPQEYSDLHRAGGLLPLTALVKEHQPAPGSAAIGTDVGLDDILPAVANHTIRYNGEIVAFPLSADMLMMYYRKDLLEKVGVMEAPATWEQVLSISRRMNGSDVDGDGLPEFGMCFEIMPGKSDGRPCALKPMHLPIVSWSLLAACICLTAPSASWLNLL
jgi:hypothetical protein